MFGQRPVITLHYHSFFTVSNLDRSVAFYQDLLGFMLEGSFEVQGSAVEQITALLGVHLRVAHLLLSGFRLELIQYLSPHGQAIDLVTNNVSSAHIAFYAADVEKTYQEFREKGVPFKRPSWPPLPVVLRVAYFMDLDGITLELSEQWA